MYKRTLGMNEYHKIEKSEFRFFPITIPQLDRLHNTHSRCDTCGGLPYIVTNENKMRVLCEKDFHLEMEHCMVSVLEWI